MGHNDGDAELMILLNSILWSLKPIKGEKSNMLLEMRRTKVLVTMVMMVMMVMVTMVLVMMVMVMMVMVMMVLIMMVLMTMMMNTIRIKILGTLVIS